MKNVATDTRFLVVSDDVTVRESLGRILESADFAVLYAGSGRDAVETLRANPVKAIVLDFKRPSGPNNAGSPAAQTLVALTDIDPFHPVLLTCESEVELEHQTLLMADLVLRHPVAPAALLEGVDMLLTESLRERVYRKSEYIAMLR
jgi:CheY-like chemotaxis protein